MGKLTKYTKTYQYTKNSEMAMFNTYVELRKGKSIDHSQSRQKRTKQRAPPQNAPCVRVAAAAAYFEPWIPTVIILPSRHDRDHNLW